MGFESKGLGAGGFRVTRRSSVVSAVMLLTLERTGQRSYSFVCFGSSASSHAVPAPTPVRRVGSAKPGARYFSHTRSS